MKPNQRRSELQQRLLEAAERKIAAKGLEALRVRQLAAEVGCAVGQIYNLYADLDGLILAVNARTLSELDERLVSATTSTGAEAAERPGTLLIAQAQIYLQFASSNRNRWQAVFQHRMSGSRELPAWYREQQATLFSHVDRPIEMLCPDMSPAQRGRLGRSIFSAVHGIVSLGIEERLGPQSYDALSHQLEMIVLAIVSGLERCDRR